METSNEWRKADLNGLVLVRQHKIIRSSWTCHREFVPFLALVLIALGVLAYYFGTTQHFTEQGKFVNLNADTVIQYFSSSENRKEDGRSPKPVVLETNSKLKTALPPLTKKINKTISSSDVGNSFTTESSEQTKVHINSKASVKLSPSTRKNKLSKSEQTATKLKWNESLFLSTKDLFVPTKRDIAILSKIENFQRKGHIIHRRLNLPIKTDTVSNVQGTVRDMKNKYSDLRRKSSTTPSPIPRTKFNFDLWYHKKTVEICGSGWQEKYRELHDDILSKRREEKYLVYLCPGTRQGCCGYGNRLRAVASLFYLSVLTDRAFLIDWRAPEPIENHLTPRNIQWNYSEPIDICTGLQIRKHYWGSTKTDVREAEGYIIQEPKHFKRWFTSTDLKQFFDWPVEEITTIWYFAEGGITKNSFLMKRAKELGIAPLISNTPKFNLIGCAFDFLFSKSKALESKLDEMRSQLQFHKGPVIGIHIRTGDDQFDYFSSENIRTWNAKNVSKFFDCATKVESEFFFNETDGPEKVRWFLSTDNEQVRTLVQGIYPQKVVTTNLTILHLDILFNTTIFNFTAQCNYTDETNTTLVCYNVEILNVTAYCLNRTKYNYTQEIGDNSTIYGSGMATEGIIAMLVDHFLLAESDFLVLCDSSFGSTAVGLGMRNTDSYILADRDCVDFATAQKDTRLKFFGRRRR
ncbi:hypothetical protein AWC38_SpisGene1872 [Stylophora pistillata]|uniref:Uncharacterized protein n=2 Tax=Stylophora pistillata TaxID=50429 RepID=A0A2B4SWM3_STYPI|nr:hypothetical protein AWC38_SpisGene1872 [Stylophora pistillata]